jgi:hypothetical protein
MSGSSAMASARRRRAGNPDPPIQSNQVTSQNNDQGNNVEITSNQRMTPLQILKIHDDKLKILEEGINKINLLNVSNNNINNNINNGIDKVNELNEIKFEQLNTKIIHLSEIVKSLQINIENISKLNIIENDQYKIMNDGIVEMNNLRNIIINTQKDIITIKDDITQSRNIYEKHDTILQNLNFENTDNDAEMLFKSVLEEQLKDNLNTNISNSLNFEKIVIDYNEDTNNDNLPCDIEVLNVTKDTYESSTDENIVSCNLLDILDINDEKINDEKINADKANTNDIEEKPDIELEDIKDANEEKEGGLEL